MKKHHRKSKTRKIHYYPDNRWDGKMKNTFSDKVKMFFWNMPSIFIILIPVGIILYLLKVSIIFMGLVLGGIFLYYLFQSFSN